MYNIHPTGSGGNRRRERLLAAKAPQETSEATVVRCFQCGFPNDLRKITSGASSDRTAALLQTTAVTLASGGTSDTRELNDSVSGGCRFCHSMNVLGNNRLRL